MKLIITFTLHIFQLLLNLKPNNSFQHGAYTTKKSLYFSETKLNLHKLRKRPSSSSYFKKAFPEQTPHSGRHFAPTSLKRSHFRRRRRFMEGWYYRVTIPNTNASFAFIVSIEDPYQPPTNLSLVALQIMGPNDEYLVQAHDDISKFWAYKYQASFGYIFDSVGTHSSSGPLSQEEFNKVNSGFQMMPLHIQGKLQGHNGTTTTSIATIPLSLGPYSCTFNLTIQPKAGWGISQSTAGWLASYPVFEPHWQVFLADAVCNGTISWLDQLYEVSDAPFYAEKNWGGTFPTKWYWVQCNSFNNFQNLSVTAGGGIRELPFRQKEDVGLVGIHYNSKFYEAVPWLGSMSWDIDPWGRWVLTGRTSQFECLLIATCTSPGVVLRAPTKIEGLVYFCRDSFLASVSLSLWEIDESTGEKRILIENATSSQGAVEVGGGPWWATWKGKSNMKQPLRGLVRFPYLVKKLKERFFGRDYDD